MLGFFKRRANKVSPMHPVWEGVGEWVAARQRRYAVWLQLRANCYSKRKLIVLLVVFCLCFGGASVFVLSGVLRGNGSAISVSPIKVPGHLADTGFSVERAPFLPEAVSRNIIQFKTYVDSLSQFNPSVIDSINRVRPGLIDSLRLIEPLLNLQSK